MFPSVSVDDKQLTEITHGIEKVCVTRRTNRVQLATDTTEKDSISEIDKLAIDRAVIVVLVIQCRVGVLEHRRILWLGVLLRLTV